MPSTFDEVLTAIADQNKPATHGAAAHPFLKWVGGKRSILPQLLLRMPAKYETYCEPFIGGGALFFAVAPERAYLADMNFSLVLTYAAVCHEVESVIKLLKVHASRHSKDHYLSARVRIGKESDPVKIAALLIYLNKTCYNGLYRVNKSGEFNVPIGSYSNPTILDEDNLRACSKELHGTEIKQHDFSHTPIRKGNFYYLDPPYHKVYSSYDSSGFLDPHHKKLAAFCTKLDRAGAFFILSNSDTPFVQNLYKGFIIERIQAGRFVSCKGDGRGKETELLIRNF